MQQQYIGPAGVVPEIHGYKFVGMCLYSYLHAGQYCITVKDVCLHEGPEPISEATLMEVKGGGVPPLSNDPVFAYKKLKPRADTGSPYWTIVSQNGRVQVCHKRDNRTVEDDERYARGVYELESLIAHEYADRINALIDEARKK